MALMPMFSGRDAMVAIWMFHEKPGGCFGAGMLERVWVEEVGWELHVGTV